MKYKEDQIVYIVENNLRVTPVRVVRVSGDLYSIALGAGRMIRLREGRLYASAEEAEKQIHKIVRSEPEIRDPHEWEYGDAYKQYKVERL